MAGSPLEVRRRSVEMVTRVTHSLESYLRHKVSISGLRKIGRLGVMASASIGASARPLWNWENAFPTSIFTDDLRRTVSLGIRC
jgi:hypothetical protein